MGLDSQISNRFRAFNHNLYLWGSKKSSKLEDNTNLRALTIGRIRLSYRWIWKRIWSNITAGLQCATLPICLPNGLTFSFVSRFRMYLGRGIESVSAIMRIPKTFKFEHSIIHSFKWQWDEVQFSSIKVTGGGAGAGGCDPIKDKMGRISGLPSGFLSDYTKWLHCN